MIPSTKKLKVNLHSSRQEPNDLDYFWENDLFLIPDAGPPEDQHILIVDDDPTILSLLKEYISALGYNLKTASNGTQALDALKMSKFTIIITDLLMPGMDGMELIRQVKTYWPDTDIIVITGYTRDYRYTDVIRAGASDFIQKPFNLDELEAKLNRLTRERQLRSLLKRLSVKDALTGLYNRRFFEFRFTEEAKRAERQSYSLFVIFIDVDKFKRYNDQQGHRAGDKLLKELSITIKKFTRDHVDSAFRYGGDEFAILLPQTEADQALQVAERIRSAFDQIMSDVTISIGIAKFKRHPDKNLAENLDILIHQADEAMYEAKDAGGNKVVMWRED